MSLLFQRHLAMLRSVIHRSCCSRALIGAAVLGTVVGSSHMASAQATNTSPQHDLLDNKPAVILDDPLWKYREGHNFLAWGFLQSRISDSNNSSGDRGPTRAEITRLRPTFSFTPDKFWDFHVQVDFTTRGRPLNSIGGRDVYVEYHNTDYFARIGQAKIPFGYEEWQESDEDRAAVERARVLTTLFPNERDTGIWFSTAEPRNPKDPGKRLIRPTYTLALLTGNGINKYYDEVGKAIVARARFPYHQNLAFDTSLF